MISRNLKEVNMKGKFDLDKTGKVINNDINVYRMNWFTYMRTFISIDWNECFVHPIKEIFVNLYFVLSAVLMITFFPATFPILSMINLKKSKIAIKLRHPDIDNEVLRLEKIDEKEL